MFEEIIGSGRILKYPPVLHGMYANEHLASCNIHNKNKVGVPEKWTNEAVVYI